MSTSPKIVFTSIRPAVRRLMWNEEAAETATKLGFNVTLPEAGEGTLTIEEWQEIFSGAEAIITTWGAPRLDAATLKKNTNLKFVGHAAGSVAAIVSPELVSRGCIVSSANKELAKAVARWCLMMTFVGLRNLIDTAQFGNGNQMVWENRAPNGELNSGFKDIPNAVVGIWGYGDISKALIDLLRPIQPREILISSRSLSKEQAAALGMRKVCLEELFARCDVIHTLQGLTEDTRGAVTASHLTSMKEGAVLINAGRAHLIDEQALYDELQRNRIRVILDVFHEEPLSAGNPLRRMPNVILTPHIAGYDGACHYVSLMLEEFDRLLKGEGLQYHVSPERALLMTDPSQSR